MDGSENLELSKTLKRIERKLDFVTEAICFGAMCAVGIITSHIVSNDWFGTIVVGGAMALTLFLTRHYKKMTTDSYF
jgi:hypothetical protein